MRLGLLLLVLMSALAGCVGPSHPIDSPSSCQYVGGRFENGECVMPTSSRQIASPPVTVLQQPFPTRDEPAVSLALLLTFAHYAFGLLVGAAVYRDARRRSWLVLGLGPLWWGAMCVFSAVIGLLAYWLMHYSRLASKVSGSNKSLQRTRGGDPGKQ